jgi:hypothetical protein
MYRNRLAALAAASCCDVSDCGIAPLLGFISDKPSEDAGARALSERNRPAGDLRDPRRYGVDAGKSGPRHCRGRRDGFPPLPSKSSAPISARSSESIPTGRRSPAGPACSRKTSTRPTCGSSATCWCEARWNIDSLLKSKSLLRVRSCSALLCHAELARPPADKPERDGGVHRRNHDQEASRSAANSTPKLTKRASK